MTESKPPRVRWIMSHGGGESIEYDEPDVTSDYYEAGHKITPVVEHSAYLDLAKWLEVAEAERDALRLQKSQWIDRDAWYADNAKKAVEEAKTEVERLNEILQRYSTSETLMKVVQERDSLAAQLSECAVTPPIATNTGWPHEKKLLERIAELEAELNFAKQTIFLKKTE